MYVSHFPKLKFNFVLQKRNFSYAIYSFKTFCTCKVNKMLTPSTWRNFILPHALVTFLWNYVSLKTLLKTIISKYQMLKLFTVSLKTPGWYLNISKNSCPILNIFNIQRKSRTSWKKAKIIKTTNPPKLSRTIPQKIWQKICQNVFWQVTTGADSHRVKKLPPARWVRVE